MFHCIVKNEHLFCLNELRLRNTTQLGLLLPEAVDITMLLQITL